MKKVILILVFALASFSMSANNNIDNQDCIEYAWNSANAELNHYGGSDEDLRLAFVDYFDMCFATKEFMGGTMFDPVFL